MFAFKLKVFIVTAGEVNGFTHLHRAEGGLCSESCLSARGHGKKIQSTPYMMLLVLSLIKLCKKKGRMAEAAAAGNRGINGKHSSARVRSRVAGKNKSLTKTCCCRQKKQTLR